MQVRQRLLICLRIRCGAVIGCNYPIAAYKCAVVSQGRLIGYEIVFDNRRGDVVAELRLPCGKCDGCKLERARQWAVRCMHEAKLHSENCFITLTYNDEHLPDEGNLIYDDFQRFMKRLRKKYSYVLKGRGRKKKQGPFGVRPIRFFMCGEYGDDRNRPHFHAALFGLDFDDKVYFKTTKAGSKLYTSATLDSLWRDKGGGSIGFATVGTLTFDSAGYIARYTLKKTSVDRQYEVIDQETGEVSYNEKEFNSMSLKPGIGKGFYDKWKADIFPHDYVIVNGKKQKPPRYYAKKLAEEDPLCYDDIQFERAKAGLARSADNTLERLEVKEKVLKAATKFLKRELI